MSSENVFSLKMLFYSALKFQVNQDHYENSLMMLHTGISQLWGSISFLVWLKQEKLKQRVLQDLDDYSLVSRLQSACTS